MHVRLWGFIVRKHNLTRFEVLYFHFSDIFEALRVLVYLFKEYIKRSNPQKFRFEFSG